MIGEDYSGSYIKTSERCSYYTGKIGAWKTCHVSPNPSTGGGGNKCGGYSGAYAPQTDFNKIDSR